MVNIFTYTKNVAKSVLYSSQDLLQEKTPAATSFVTSNREIVKETYTLLKDYRHTFKRLSTYVKNSRIYEAATEGIKAGMEDLRSGTFYNKKRISEFEDRAMGDMADFGDDSFSESDWDLNSGDDEQDWDFGDTEISAGDAATIKATHEASMDNAEAITTAVYRSANATVEVSKANTMLLLNQQQKANSIMEKGFSSIFDQLNTNRQANEEMMKAHQTVAEQFYNDSIRLMQDQNNMIHEMLELQKKQMGMIEQQQKEEKKKLYYDDIVTGEGVPDLKQYFANVKKNAYNALPQEIKMMTTNMVGGENANNLLAWVSSPLKAIPDIIAKTIIPKTVTYTMQEFDKTISGSFAGLMANLAKIAKDDERSPIAKYLAQTFGVKVKSAETPSTADYEKGAMQFNGIANKALTEVIPGYLRRIESVLTGEGERVYSYSSGSWTTGRELIKRRKDANEQPIASAFADMKEWMSDILRESAMFTNSDWTKVSKQLNSFLSRVITEDMGNPRFKMDEETYRKNNDYGVESRELMKAFVAAYNSASRGLKSQMSRNAFDAKTNIANRISSIFKDPEMRELLNGSDIDKGYSWDEKGNRKKAPGFFYNNTIDKILDDKGHNIYWYLQKMYTELVTFRVNNYGNSSGGGGGNNGGGASPTPPQPVNMGSAAAAAPAGGRRRRVARPIQFSNNAPDYVTTRFLADITPDDRKDKNESWRERERNEAQRQKWANDKKNKGKFIYDPMDYDNISLMANAVIENGRRRSLPKNNYEGVLASRAYQDYYAENSTFLDEWIEEARAEREKRRKEEGKVSHSKTSTKALADSVERDINAKGTKQKEDPGLISKLLAAETITEKFEVLTNDVNNLLEAPGKFLTNIMLKADERLYNLVFGDEETHYIDGRPVKGILDEMVYHIKDTFKSVNTWIDEKILEPLKEKLGIETFGDLIQKVGEKFGFDFKKSRENFVDWLFKENPIVEVFKKETKDMAKDIADEFMNQGGLGGTAEEVAARAAEQTRRERDERNNRIRDTLNKRKSYYDFISGGDRATTIDRLNQVTDKGYDKTANAQVARYAARRDMLKNSHGEFDSNESAITAYFAKTYKSYAELIKDNPSLAVPRDKVPNMSAQEYNQLCNQILATYNANVSRKRAIAEVSIPSYILDLFNQHNISTLEDYTAWLDESVQMANGRNFYQYANKKSHDKRISDSRLTAFQDIMDKIQNSSLTQRTKEIYFDDGTTGTRQDYSTGMIDINSIFNSGDEVTNQFLRDFWRDSDRKTKVELRDKGLVGHRGINISTDAQKQAFIDFITSQNESRRKNAVRNAISNNDLYAALDDQRFKSMLGSAVDPIAYLTQMIEEETHRNKVIDMSYNGSRYVTKTGITTIHEGEMVVPSELNPFNPNRHKVNKAQEVADEKRVKNRFLSRISRAINSNAEGASTVMINPQTGAQVDTGTINQTVDEANEDKKLKVVTGEQINEAIGKAVGWVGKTVGLSDKQVDDIQKNSANHIGSGLAGGLLGAGGGLLSSMLFGIAGGPLIGAAVGVAGGLAKSSESFSKYLFGDFAEGQYDDGKQRRTGGLIDQEVQEAFHKYAPSMGRWGLGGAALSMLTPLGPIGGALIGSTIGYLKKNEDFTNFLYGTEDSLLGPDGEKKLKKAIPNAALGSLVAVAGGALIGSPFGLLGTALIGSTVGIASTSEKFQELMLGKKIDTGKKDKDGNPIYKRQGGVAGLIKQITIDPVVSGIKLISNTMKDVVKNDIVAPLKDAVKPIGQMIKNMFHSIGNGITGFINKWFESRLGVPIQDFVHDKIIDPIGRIAKGIITAPLKLAGKAISLPFRTLGAIGNNIRANQIKGGTAADMTAQERLDWRDSHKIRSKKIFGIGMGPGMDGYRSLDENLNDMSQEDLIKLSHTVKQLDYAKRHKGDYVQSTKEAIAGTVNEFFDDTKHANLLTFSKNSNARKKILQAIKDGEYDEAFKLIRKIKSRDGSTLSDEEANDLISRLEDKISDHNDAKAAKKLVEGKEGIRGAEEKLRKLGFKNIDMALRYTNAEISGRKKNGNWEDLSAEATKSIENNTDSNNKLIDALHELTQVISGRMLIMKTGSYSSTFENESKIPTGYNEGGVWHEFTGDELNNLQAVAQRNNNNLSQDKIDSIVERLRSGEDVKPSQKMYYGAEKAKRSASYQNANMHEEAEYAKGASEQNNRNKINKLKAIFVSSNHPFKEDIAKKLNLADPTISKRIFNVANTGAVSIEVLEIINDLPRTNEGNRNYNRIFNYASNYSGHILTKSRAKALCGLSDAEWKEIFTIIKKYPHIDMDDKGTFEFLRKIQPETRKYDKHAGLVAAYDEFCATSSQNHLSLKEYYKEYYKNGKRSTATIDEELSAKTKTIDEAAAEAEDIVAHAFGGYADRDETAVVSEGELIIDPSQYLDFDNIPSYAKGNKAFRKRFENSKYYQMARKKIGERRLDESMSDEQKAIEDKKDMDYARYRYNQDTNRLYETEGTDQFGQAVDDWNALFEEQHTDLLDSLLTTGRANYFVNDRRKVYKLSKKKRGLLDAELAKYNDLEKAINNSEYDEEVRQAKQEEQTGILKNIQALLSYNVDQDGNTLEKLLKSTNKDGKKNIEVYIDKRNPKNKKHLQEGQVDNESNSHLKEIAGWFKDKGTAIGNFFTEPVNKDGSSRMDSIFKGIKTVAKASLGFGIVATALKMLSPDVYKKASALWNEGVVPTVQDFWQNKAQPFLTETVPSGVNKAINAIGDFASKAGSWAMDNVGFIGNILGTSLVTFGSIMAGVLPSAAATIYKSLEQITGLDGNGNSVSLGMRAVGAGVKAMLHGSSGKALKEAGRFATRMPTFAGKLLGTPIGVAMSATGEVINLGGKVGTRVNGGLNSILDSTISTVTSRNGNKLLMAGSEYAKYGLANMHVINKAIAYGGTEALADQAVRVYGENLTDAALKDVVRGADLTSKYLTKNAGKFIPTEKAIKEFGEEGAEKIARAMNEGQITKVTKSMGRAITNDLGTKTVEIAGKDISSKLYKSTGEISDWAVRQFGEEGAQEIATALPYQAGRKVTMSMATNAAKAASETSAAAVTNLTQESLKVGLTSTKKAVTEETADKIIEKGVKTATSKMTAAQMRKAALNAATNAASDLSVEAVSQSVRSMSRSSVAGKIAGALAGLCQKMKKHLVEYCGADKATKVIAEISGSTFSERILKKATAGATGALARIAAGVASMGIVDIVFAVADFLGPILNPADAQTILGLLRPPTFWEQVLAGIMQCILGLPFCAYGLIPPEIISWALFDLVLPILNIDNDITRGRQEARDIVALFNQQYGTNLSVDDYNYLVQGNKSFWALGTEWMGGKEEGMIERIKNDTGTDLSTVDFSKWKSGAAYTKDADGNYIYVGNEDNSAYTANTTDKGIDLFSEDSALSKVLNSISENIGKLVSFFTGEKSDDVTEDTIVNGNGYTFDQLVQYFEDQGFSATQAQWYAERAMTGEGSGRYSQNDQSINRRFNKKGDTIYQDVASSGCGPIAATNLINRNTKYGMGMINPSDAVDYALSGGYKETNGGTDPRYFKDYFRKNGIDSKITSSREEMRKAIKNGQQVVLMGKDSHYGMGSTPYGPNYHYVVATGLSGKNLIVDNPEENNEYTAYDYDSTIGKSTKAIITSSRPKYGMGSNEVLGIAGSDLSIVPPALTEALSKLPTESNITVYKYSDSDNLNMPYLKSDSPIMQLSNVVSDSNLSKPTKANISEIPSILDNATIKEALATGDFDKYYSERDTNTKYTLGGNYYSIKNAWDDSEGALWWKKRKITNETAIKDTINDLFSYFNTPTTKVKNMLDKLNNENNYYKSYEQYLASEDLLKYRKPSDNLGTDSATAENFDTLLTAAIIKAGTDLKYGSPERKYIHSVARGLFTAARRRARDFMVKQMVNKLYASNNNLTSDEKGRLNLYLASLADELRSGPSLMNSTLWDNGIVLYDTDEASLFNNVDKDGLIDYLSDAFTILESNISDNGEVENAIGKQIYGTALNVSSNSHGITPLYGDDSSTNKYLSKVVDDYFEGFTDDNYPNLISPTFVKNAIRTDVVKRMQEDFVGNYENGELIATERLKKAGYPFAGNSFKYPTFAEWTDKGQNLARIYIKLLKGLDKSEWDKDNFIVDFDTSIRKVYQKLLNPPEGEETKSENIFSDLLPETLKHALNLWQSDTGNLEDFPKCYGYVTNDLTTPRNIANTEYESLFSDLFKEYLFSDYNIGPDTTYTSIKIFDKIISKIIRQTVFDSSKYNKLNGIVDNYVPKLIAQTHGRLSSRNDGAYLHAMNESDIAFLNRLYDELLQYTIPLNGDKESVTTIDSVLKSGDKSFLDATPIKVITRFKKLLDEAKNTQIYLSDGTDVGDRRETSIKIDGTDYTTSKILSSLMNYLAGRSDGSDYTPGDMYATPSDSIFNILAENPDETENSSNSSSNSLPLNDLERFDRYSDNAQKKLMTRILNLYYGKDINSSSDPYEIIRTALAGPMDTDLFKAVYLTPYTNSDEKRIETYFSPAFSPAAMPSKDETAMFASIVKKFYNAASSKSLSKFRNDIASTLSAVDKTNYPKIDKIIQEKFNSNPMYIYDIMRKSKDSTYTSELNDFMNALNNGESYVSSLTKLKPYLFPFADQDKLDYILNNELTLNPTKTNSEDDPYIDQHGNPIVAPDSGVSEFTGSAAKHAFEDLSKFSPISTTDVVNYIQNRYKNHSGSDGKIFNSQSIAVLINNLANTYHVNPRFVLAVMTWEFGLGVPYEYAKTHIAKRNYISIMKPGEQGASGMHDFSLSSATIAEVTLKRCNSVEDALENTFKYFGDIAMKKRSQYTLFSLNYKYGYSFAGGEPSWIQKISDEMDKFPENTEYSTINPTSKELEFYQKLNKCAYSGDTTGEESGEKNLKTLFTDLAKAMFGEDIYNFVTDLAGTFTGSSTSSKRSANDGMANMLRSIRYTGDTAATDFFSTGGMADNSDAGGTSGVKITSRFGYRGDDTDIQALGSGLYQHWGTDYVMNNGSKNVTVSSPINGKIVGTYPNSTGGYGNYVVAIDDNPNDPHIHLFGHLKRIDSSLKPDNNISIGDPIGLMGNTGIHTGGEDTGYHLHYGVGKLANSDSSTLSSSGLVKNFYYEYGARSNNARLGDDDDQVGLNGTKGHFSTSEGWVDPDAYISEYNQTIEDIPDAPSVTTSDEDNTTDTAETGQGSGKTSLSDKLITDSLNNKSAKGGSDKPLRFSRSEREIIQKARQEYQSPFDPTKDSEPVAKGKGSGRAETEGSTAVLVNATNDQTLVLSDIRSILATIEQHEAQNNAFLKAFLEAVKNGEIKPDSKAYTDMLNALTPTTRSTSSNSNSANTQTLVNTMVDIARQ